LLEIVLFVSVSVGITCGGDPETWTAVRVFPSSNTWSSVTFAFDDTMPSPDEAPVISACERVRLPPVRLKIVPPLDSMIVVAWLFPTMVMSLLVIVARVEPTVYVVTSPVFGTPGRSISWATPRAAA